MIKKERRKRSFLIQGFDLLDQTLPRNRLFEPLDRHVERFLALIRFDQREDVADLVCGAELPRRFIGEQWG